MTVQVPCTGVDAFFFLISWKGMGKMRKEGQIRIPSGCAIAAVISRNGERMPGDLIAKSMEPMHERSNGLGGGFAGYGIYPEYRDFYALHLFFDSRDVRKECETLLKEYFEIVQSEIIPTRNLLPRQNSFLRNSEREPSVLREPKERARQQACFIRFFRI